MGSSTTCVDSMHGAQRPSFALSATSKLLKRVESVTSSSPLAIDARESDFPTATTHMMALAQRPLAPRRRPARGASPEPKPQHQSVPRHANSNHLPPRGQIEFAELIQACKQHHEVGVVITPSNYR